VLLLDLKTWDYTHYICLEDSATRTFTLETTTSEGSTGGTGGIVTSHISPTQTGGPHAPSHAGAIAGGVVGGIVFIGAVVGGIIFYLRKRKQRQARTVMSEVSQT
jgi:hypothetical protein